MNRKALNILLLPNEFYPPKRPPITDLFAKEMPRRGHKICDEDKGFGFGGYQAIMCDGQGGYLGASENRKDGCAMGY